jgi:hypothetical protein
MRRVLNNPTAILKCSFKRSSCTFKFPNCALAVTLCRRRSRNTRKTRTMRSFRVRLLRSHSPMQPWVTSVRVNNLANHTANALSKDTDRYLSADHLTEIGAAEKTTAPITVASGQSHAAASALPGRHFANGSAIRSRQVGSNSFRTSLRARSCTPREHARTSALAGSMQSQFDRKAGATEVKTGKTAPTIALIATAILGRRGTPSGRERRTAFEVRPRHRHSRRWRTGYSSFPVAQTLASSASGGGLALTRAEGRWSGPASRPLTATTNFRQTRFRLARAPRVRSRPRGPADPLGRA